MEVKKLEYEEREIIKANYHHGLVSNRRSSMHSKRLFVVMFRLQ